MVTFQIKKKITSFLFLHEVEPIECIDRALALNLSYTQSPEGLVRCCCLLFVMAPICWPTPFRFYCHSGILVIWWQQQSERRGGFPEGPPTPCYQTPPGGEKMHSEEAPKIRALIKIYCGTSLWTADMSVIQGPVLSRFSFSRRASVQTWWKKLLLYFT